jgi:hypothetical protein
MVREARTPPLLGLVKRDTDRQKESEDACCWNTSEDWSQPQPIQLFG